MEFHGTARVSEIGAPHVYGIPWNSMEPLVPAKLAQFKFYGIPWNCSCQQNWRKLKFHVRLGNGVCHVGPRLAAVRKRHRRYTRCKECGAGVRGWLLLRWSFACTWRPNECQRALLCRNNRRHPMQYQAGASPWDRHIAVGNPVAGQWTRDDSPALELWLGPLGPERWGDWVYRGHPNMSHVVY